MHGPLPEDMPCPHCGKPVNVREYVEMEEARYWLGREMTMEDAARVARIRMEYGETWRGVASEMDLPPDFRGNQIAGMSLCRAASIMLGQEVD